MLLDESDWYHRVAIGIFRPVVTATCRQVDKIARVEGFKSDGTSGANDAKPRCQGSPCVVTSLMKSRKRLGSRVSAKPGFRTRGTGAVLYATCLRARQ
jgi:hypothetical protein